MLEMVVKSTLVLFLWLISAVDLQGMSDLLSPILYVMRDETESFWCFASLMERLGPNFNRDQNGMHSQLFALSKVLTLIHLNGMSLMCMCGYLYSHPCSMLCFLIDWFLGQC